MITSRRGILSQSFPFMVSSCLSHLDSLLIITFCYCRGAHAARKSNYNPRRNTALPVGGLIHLPLSTRPRVQKSTRVTIKEEDAGEPHIPLCVFVPSSNTSTVFHPSTVSLSPGGLQGGRKLCGLEIRLPPLLQANTLDGCFIQSERPVQPR